MWRRACAARRHYEAAKQLALADQLVLTKTDLVSAATRDAVLARLKALNPLAPVAIVIQGQVSPDLFFGADAPGPDLRQDRLAAAAALGHEHHHDEHDGDHDHIWRTITASAPCR